MKIERADGLPTSSIVDLVRYHSRGSGLVFQEEEHRLVLIANSVAAGSHLNLTADTLRRRGVLALVVGDQLIIDLLWCPIGASIEGRQALVEAFAEQTRVRALSSKKTAARASVLAQSSKDTYNLLTFAEISAEASRHLSLTRWPMGVAVGDFRL